MYGVKETKKIKDWNNKEWIKNICIVNGREAVRHADGYYYLNKQGNISKTRAKLQ